MNVEIEFPHQNDVLQTLTDINALIKGHFVYTSGRHGNEYILKDKLRAYPIKTKKLCQYLAEQFRDDRIEVVVGPATGGIILSQYVAAYLGDQVFSVFTEKGKSGHHEFNRGYSEFVKGKRVLVTEDNLTTGSSVRDAVNAVKAAGGKVIGVSAICNRGGVKKEDIGNPEKFVCLANIPLESWEGNGCPLCADGTPINTNAGKGADFLAQN